MPLRLRTDAFWWTAGAKRAILLGARSDPRQDASKDWDEDFLKELNDDGFEPAMPGDVWRTVVDPTDMKTSSWLPREGWLLGG